MNESGPIRKTEKDQHCERGYSDFFRIAANVWRADCDGKRWLLKTVKEETAESARLLRREYELSCKLQHPFILGASRFEQDTEKGPAIVMEYVEGRTLREFVRENPSAVKRRKVLMQLLDAVEYLHRMTVLHNDIKPENILITATGDDVKVIDFGLSEKDADFLERRLGGTPGASAPEVLAGDTDSTSTGASDIYSLGGIIALMFRTRYSGVVRKCRRTAPEDRYKDVHSLRRAIELRDRSPWICAGVFVICGLLAAALLPDMLRVKEEIKAEEETCSAVNGIRMDMDLFFKQASDSISNRAVVPYREFASNVLNNFVNRTLEYRNSLGQEMLPVYDSIYSRMVCDLSAMMTEIPLFSGQSDKGLMSVAEENRCYELFMEGKPYTPLD